MRARKAEERTQKVKQGSRKRAPPAPAEPTGSDHGENTDVDPSTARHQTVREGSGNAPKRPRLQEEAISCDTCCVCFQHYNDGILLGTGAEWVQCVCERWLHEDCIVDYVIDKNGKERLCPFCT